MPLPFTGTGDETRDFTFVGDIVDGLLRAGYFESAIGEEFNLASGREIKILEMAEKVNALVGNKAGILRAPPRVWDTKKRLLASVEKAGKLIGYNPDQDFDAGLKITVQWFKDNWDAIDRDAEFPPGMSSAVQGVTDEKELEVPVTSSQAKAS
jgi:nucleoside-diphosphate-sugar epimerase